METRGCSKFARLENSVSREIAYFDESTAQLSVPMHFLRSLRSEKSLLRYLFCANCTFQRWRILRDEERSSAPTLDSKQTSRFLAITGLFISLFTM